MKNLKKMLILLLILFAIFETIEANDEILPEKITNKFKNLTDEQQYQLLYRLWVQYDELKKIYEEQKNIYDEHEKKIITNYEDKILQLEKKLSHEKKDFFGLQFICSPGLNITMIDFNITIGANALIFVKKYGFIKIALTPGVSADLYKDRVLNFNFGLCFIF